MKMCSTETLNIRKLTCINKNLNLSNLRCHKMKFMQPPGGYFSIATGVPYKKKGIEYLKESGVSQTMVISGEKSRQRSRHGGPGQCFRTPKGASPQ